MLVTGPLPSLFKCSPVTVTEREADELMPTSMASSDPLSRKRGLSPRLTTLAAFGLARSTESAVDEPANAVLARATLRFDTLDLPNIVACIVPELTGRGFKSSSCDSVSVGFDPTPILGPTSAMEYATSALTKTSPRLALKSAFNSTGPDTLKSTTYLDTTTAPVVVPLSG